MFNKFIEMVKNSLLAQICTVAIIFIFIGLLLIPKLHVGAAFIVIGTLILILSIFKFLEG